MMTQPLPWKATSLLLVVCCHFRERFLISNLNGPWHNLRPFSLVLNSLSFVSPLPLSAAVVIVHFHFWCSEPCFHTILTLHSVSLSVNTYRSAIARTPRQCAPNSIPTAAEVIIIPFLHINAVLVYCFGISLSIPVHIITVLLLL